MKILFLVDPISKLKAQTDTSLALMREAFERGKQCFLGWADDVFWNVDYAALKAHSVLKSGDQNSLPVLKEAVLQRITDFDLVFIRKDPPFDDSYLRLCWFLAPFETKVRFSNRPSQLLRFHEKMLPFEAAASGALDRDDFIPSCISKSSNEVRSFVENLKENSVIVKPWLGHGGRDVQLFDKEKLLENLDALLRTQEEMIFQAFQEEVKTLGDRRVFFMGGRHVGDFVRLPQSGQHISNMAQGGKALLRSLRENEMKLVKKLENFLSVLKIDFAGADLIGARVNEINITSPTGLLTYKELAQQDLCSIYLKHLESEMK